MVSPVNTNVKWARSTMPGAPALTRAAGSLIGLLDALLVNGWGQQTASSVTVAAGIATANFPTDHAAARHSVVLVAGVAGAYSDLNGEQKVIAVESNKVKWSTSLPDGTAAGTITVKMAPAGFAKPFSGTNLAAYKSTAPEAHGQFLRVNDGTLNAARVVGYENMTAISTGTGLFPTSAQVNGGYYWGKDDDTSATASVPWWFFSDGRTFYLCPMACQNSYGGLTRSFHLQAFGDLVPESPAGDPFASVLTGAPDSGWPGVGPVYMLSYFGPDYAVASPRARSGAGSGIRPPTQCDLLLPTTLALPNPISGAIPMGRIYTVDTTSEFPRATFPGVYFCQAQVDSVIKMGDILEMPSGRTVVALSCGSQVHSQTSLSAMFVDVTGPWR